MADHDVFDVGRVEAELRKALYDLGLDRIVE
jgi:hypothetical protein